MIKEVKKAKLNNEELFLKEALNKQKSSKAEDVSTLSDEQLYAMSQDDQVLESIIEEIRFDSSKASDSNYRKIFNYVIEDNIKEFSALKDLIKKQKDIIYNRVNKKDSFQADINNNSKMKTYYKNVFGRNSKTISFEDYVVLLEMKRVIEIDEQVELADVEEV